MSAEDDDQKKAGGGWRDKTRFRQGERYSADKNGQASGTPLLPLFIAGGAMLLATFTLRALGAGGFIAFLIGLAAFVLAIIALYRGSSTEPPKRRKVKQALGVDTAVVTEKLDAAEADLKAIDAAAAGLPLDLRNALGDMTAGARRVLDQIAEDPLDLDRARKFLVAYLPSARRAVEKYVNLGVQDSELETRFATLVDEMRETCRRQEQTLHSDDVFEFEVEADTLSERLRSEQ